ncbi:hypothetical protein QOZ80_2AG0128460 [Eleusine coracana subsp. coracana]|nr:hypothetical protein QOZ80_2AG0128460 [Eleusine coracana subsp. coracana]
MEILVRLPAKSVGRFRCVSRSWCAMLSSDYFVDFYRRRANRKGRPRLLLAPVGSSYNGHLYSCQHSGVVEQLMPADFSDGGIVPLSKPCHGLILFRGTDHGGHFVCNPSTGEVLPLPDSKAALKMIRRTKAFEPHVPPFFVRVSYGLGYCAVRKEYKVVRLFSNPEDEDGMMATSCEGRWHHYLNISDETFGSLSLPSPPGFDNVEPLLTELDGSLCVCYGEPDSQDPYYRIAPLGMCYSDGVQKIMSGTVACKVIAVDLDGSLTPQILFTPDETIGGCEDNDVPVLGWSLGYYDPKTATIDTIYTEEIPEHGMKFCPIICHESLVCPFSPR